MHGNLLIVEYTGMHVSASFVYFIACFHRRISAHPSYISVRFWPWKYSVSKQRRTLHKTVSILKHRLYLCLTAAQFSSFSRKQAYGCGLLDAATPLPKIVAFQLFICYVRLELLLKRAWKDIRAATNVHHLKHTKRSRSFDCLDFGRIRICLIAGQWW